MKPEINLNKSQIKSLFSPHSKRVGKFKAVKKIKAGHFVEKFEYFCEECTEKPLKANFIDYYLSTNPTHPINVGFGNICKYRLDKNK